MEAVYQALLEDRDHMFNTGWIQLGVIYQKYLDNSYEDEGGFWTQCLAVGLTRTQHDVTRCLRWAAVQRRH